VDKEIKNIWYYQKDGLDPLGEALRPPKISRGFYQELDSIKFRRNLRTTKMTSLSYRIDLEPSMILFVPALSLLWMYSYHTRLDRRRVL